MPQLLELVERAARGDQQIGAQLFPALQQMAGAADALAETRQLARVLALIVVGDRNPALDALPDELASAVRGLLARLRE